MEVLGLEAAAKPNSEVAKFIDAEDTVKRHEKEVVAGAVRNFRDGIVEQLKESTNWNWNYLNSGSSYDGTKVTLLVTIHIIIGFHLRWHEGNLAGCYPHHHCSRRLRPHHYQQYFQKYY